MLSLKTLVRCSIKLKCFVGYPHCIFGNFHEGFIFAKLRICRSFVKMKSSQNGRTALLFTDIGKLCHSRNFHVTICVIKLFLKIKFSLKFPNLQYSF